jgi:DNA-binding NarL/FixJ family response regulator
MGDAAWAAAQAAGLRLSLAEAIAEARAMVPQPAVAGDQPGSNADSLLTSREAEVLRLLVEGHSDREIAETLFVTRATASKHVSNILAKLGVDSRGAAAAQALRDALI